VCVCVCEWFLVPILNNASLLLKGVPRRKKKIVHKTATTDEKKLQSSLKKLTVNNIQGIDEVSF
jgi:hypothetical protein